MEVLSSEKRMFLLASSQQFSVQTGHHHINYNISRIFLLVKIGLDRTENCLFKGTSSLNCFSLVFKILMLLCHLNLNFNKCIILTLGHMVA
jgi:hypothetical protein